VAGEHDAGLLLVGGARLRYLETDVHATADGVLIAFHDHTLDRVTTAGRVLDLPWATSVRPVSTEPIPLLEDVLGAGPTSGSTSMPSTRRPSPRCGRLERTRSMTGSASGVLERRRETSFRRLGVAGCAPDGEHRDRPPPAGGLGLPTPAFAAPCTHVPARCGPVPVVDRRFLDEAHRRDIAVHVWTITTPPR